MFETVDWAIPYLLAKTCCGIFAFRAVFIFRTAPLVSLGLLLTTGLFRFIFHLTNTDFLRLMYHRV